MAPADDKPRTKKGRVTVTHGSKCDKDISKEPEIKELKRMTRDGKLDPDRTVEHLKREDT